MQLKALHREKKDEQLAVGLGEAGKKKVTLIKQRIVTLALIAARASNPFSLQIEQYFQIISNCSKVLPSPFMLGNLCPSQTGTKGSKILLYASSSELLFQEPFLLFSQPAFQVLLQNEVLALGTRLIKIERKHFFFT